MYNADVTSTEHSSKRLSRETRRNRKSDRFVTAVVFLVPAITLFTLFVMMPIGEAAWYSLFRWNGFGAPTNSVGLKNFQMLLQMDAFHVAVRNTGLIILISLAVQLPLGLYLALILSQKFRGVVLWRSLFFMPFVLAEVATGLIWKFVYDGRFGLAAAFTKALGMDPVYVLADQQLAIYAVIVVLVWKFFGFHMMLYIAGLQNIPRDVVESARLDGASWWQIARHIKIPMILPVIKLSIFFSVLGGLQVFDLVWSLTRGGPVNASHTVVTFLYDFGIMRMRIGFGSAVGVVIFVACVGFAFSYRRIFMKEA
ncbi:sugar ABC transporter permease [Halocynthiibacter sp. C4]|uniref:carbohydrate ABC transporter permease n=1 Tax=Halocynthiibacter sp. C4 TaxID=2992758 RepID=UPI00237A5B6A|nr:sugar ABC transporter permease [Halocynthiibacter sp. C4]MDE0589692.1 sugar ABC transporter permease [Halocynthiibacter sp. C4]